MYLSLDYVFVKRCSVDDYDMWCYDFMVSCGSLHPYICLVFKPFEKCFTFAGWCADFIQFELSQWCVNRLELYRACFLVVLFCVYYFVFVATLEHFLLPLVRAMFSLFLSINVFLRGMELPHTVVMPHIRPLISASDHPRSWCSLW
jgi:hypothetical protein